MIAIDTSALVAVITHEAERLRFLEIIAGSDRCLISDLGLFETRLVTFSRYGHAGETLLEVWLASFEPEIVAFDEKRASAAMQAFKVYGKGIHAEARLNLGDCASYALAKTHNIPLLYKGADFSATDISPAA
ncbi:MAG: type II toxin-antitoxin system VapC family toxin [Hyphomicrobiaceae bacterium]|nr:type II toxin-antitoxin system VapC family toxin [Hyphomicrobiaceae bacterium]